MQVLDVKLSALQDTLALQTEVVPKYIWGPEENVSPEVIFRDPDMVHPQVWGTSVDGVVSEGWTFHDRQA